MADHEPSVIEASDLTPGALPEWDWPPVTYAVNDHILVWWLPDYDEVLRQLVDEYQWAWRSQVLTELESRVPEAVLRGWREVDPQCREYSWYNVLDIFSARAKQLGIRPREPRLVVCSCCSREFLESHLAYRFIVSLGVNCIDVYLFRTVHPKDRGLYTPAEVAEAINETAGERVISCTYVWQLRTGRRDNPTQKHLSALAAFFGVSPMPARRPRTILLPAQKLGLDVSAWRYTYTLGGGSGP